MGSGAVRLVSVWDLKGHGCYVIGSASVYVGAQRSAVDKMFPLEIARCPSLSHTLRITAPPQVKAVRVTAALDKAWPAALDIPAQLFFSASSHRITSTLPTATPILACCRTAFTSSMAGLSVGISQRSRLQHSQPCSARCRQSAAMWAGVCQCQRAMSSLVPWNTCARRCRPTKLVLSQRHPAACPIAIRA